MRYSVGRHADAFAVVRGSDVVRSPKGTPVVTRHEGLAEEMANDVAAWGEDPSRTTTAFSLQAGYLDFGKKWARARLEQPILAQWTHDLMLQRPADPELMMPLSSLWGPVPYPRAGFEAHVKSLRLRHVMVLMQCGAQYASAALGLELLRSDRPEGAFAMGACARYFGFLNRNLTIENGYVNFGASTAARHDPFDTDDDFCERSCCTQNAELSAHPDRCPIARILMTMRRWAAWEEE